MEFARSVPGIGVLSEQIRSMRALQLKRTRSKWSDTSNAARNPHEEGADEVHTDNCVLITWGTRLGEASFWERDVVCQCQECGTTCFKGCGSREARYRRSSLRRIEDGQQGGVSWRCGKMSVQYRADNAVVFYMFDWAV